MNSSTSISKARRAICVGCLLLVVVSKAATNPPTPDDLVSFFKQAIKSPPAVEDFVGSARSLRVSDLAPTIRSGTNSQPPIFYQGARAGTNFFLRMLGDSASAPANAPIGLTVGRETTNVYEVNRNTVTYGIGNSPMEIPNNLSFNLLSHFLNMGLINVKPESVDWEDNTFHALDIRGGDIYGKLETSNDRPSSLKIARTKGGPPYKMYEYFYAEPATSLGGFPHRTEILTSIDQGLAPLSEFELLSVHLAPEHLSNGFFAPLKFTGTNITHTNLYSNADLYVSLKDGRMRKVPTGPKEPPTIPSARRRAIVFTLLVTLAAGPIIIFVATRKKRATMNNKQP